MHVRTTLAAAVAASLTLGACASAGGGARQYSNAYTDAAAGGAATLSSDQRAAASAPMVRVENRNWSDVVVYAVREGRRQRLGMVTSMSSARFRLPASMVHGSGDLQLTVDPIGSSRGFTSERILVNPGQVIAFSVQNYLPMSTVSVWDR